MMAVSYSENGAIFQGARNVKIKRKESTENGIRNDQAHLIKNRRQSAVGLVKRKNKEQ